MKFFGRSEGALCLSDTWAMLVLIKPFNRDLSELTLSGESSLGIEDG